MNTNFTRILGLGFSRTNALLDSSRSVHLRPFRLMLLFYFLTYGVFGYGSDLDFSAPASLLPALSGLALGGLLLGFGSKFPLHEKVTLSITVRHIVIFFGFFLLLSLRSLTSISREPVADELSYVQLAQIHSLEILRRLPEIQFEMGAGSALRLITFGLLVLFWLFASKFIFGLDASRAILIVFGGTAFFQAVFAAVGGWGWGYPKVSWIPFLITTTAFGVETEVFRLTALALVSLGGVLLFESMGRVSKSTLIRLGAVLSAFLLPIPGAFFSSIDHVLYFVVFAVPALPYLLRPPASHELSSLISFLALGVIFRLPVAFILIALLFGWLFRERFHPKKLSDLGLAVVALGMLIPYFLGTLMAPPVFSSRDGSQGLSFEAALVELPRVAWAQMGDMEMLIAIALLLCALALTPKLLPGVTVFTLFLAFFYFLALGASGLIGELKYSVEWGVSIVLLGVLSSFLLNPSGRMPKSLFRIVPLLTIASFVASGLTFDFGLIRPGETRERVTLEAVGYQDFLSSSDSSICVPTGVVYGVGNEILVGRTIGEVLETDRLYRIVSEKNAAISTDWTTLEEGALFGLDDVTCIYGSDSAFRSLPWEGWKSTKERLVPNSDVSFVVLRRIESPQLQMGLVAEVKRLLPRS